MVSQGADGEPRPTRSERREARRRAARERIAKHGAGLRWVYRDAVLKRARRTYRKR